MSQESPKDQLSDVQLEQTRRRYSLASERYDYWVQLALIELQELRAGRRLREQQLCEALTKCRERIEHLEAAQQPAIEGLSEADFLVFLSRKYVQHADGRQQEMGLKYMTAETHDLARELARHVANCLRIKSFS